MWYNVYTKYHSLEDSHLDKKLKVLLQAKREGKIKSEEILKVINKIKQSEKVVNKVLSEKKD